MKSMTKKTILLIVLISALSVMIALPAYSAAAEGNVKTTASGFMPLATTDEIYATDTFIEAANKIKTEWSKTWGTETEGGQYRLKDYLDTSKMDGTAHCLDCGVVLSLPKCASCKKTMTWSSSGLAKCTNASCANAYSVSKGTGNYVVPNDTCSKCNSKNIEYRWYDVPTTRQPDSNDPSTSDLISVTADGTQIIRWTPSTSVCGEGRRACAADILSYLALRFGDTEAMLYSNRAGHLAKPLYSSSSYYGWNQEWTNAGRSSTKSVTVAYFDNAGNKLGTSIVAVTRKTVTEYAVNLTDSATFVAVDNKTLRENALSAAPKGYDDNSGHMEIESVEAFAEADMKSFAPDDVYDADQCEVSVQWANSSDCCSYVSHAMYSYFSVMSQAQVDAGKVKKNAVKFLPSSILTCPAFQYMYNYLTLSEGTSADSEEGDISSEISRFNNGTNAIVGADTSSQYWKGNNYERYRAWANCFEPVRDASYMQPGDIIIYYGDSKQNVGHVEIFEGWVDESDKMAGVYVLSAGSNTAIRGTYNGDGDLISASIKRTTAWSQSNMTEHSATTSSVYGIIGILRMRTGSALTDALNSISASFGMQKSAMSNYRKPATAKYTVSLNLNLPSGETVETVTPLNGELNTSTKKYVRSTTVYSDTSDDMAPLTIFAGETEKLPIVTSHKTFLGWNTKADGTGTSYAPGASISPTSDVTLYAQWGEAGTFYVKYYMNTDVASGLPTENNAATFNEAKMTAAFGDRGVHGMDENGEYVKVAYSLGSSYSGAKTPSTCGFIANKGFSTSSSVWSTAKLGNSGKIFTPSTGAMAKGLIRFSDGSMLTLTNDAEIELYAQWDASVWYVTYHLNAGYVAGERTDIPSAKWRESSISKKIDASRIETGTDDDGPWVKVCYSCAASSYSSINPSAVGFSAAKGFSIGEKFWNTEADGTGRSFVSGTGVYRCLTMKDTDGVPMTVGKGSTTDLYLQMEWGTVSFDANGGEGTMEEFQYSAADNGAKLPANTFTRVGYAFSGWNTEADGSGQSFEDEATLGTKTPSRLYAQWTPNKYMLSFNLNGGNGTASPKEVVFGATVTLPLTNASREGYSFMGWLASPDEKVAYTDGADVKYSKDGDLTLFATWLGSGDEKPKCTISYDANGGTGSMESVSDVDLDSYVCPENGFSRDGFDFVGWSLTSAGDSMTRRPAESLGVAVTETTDLTLYAVWKERSQPIVFSLFTWFDEEVDKDAELDPMETITTAMYKYTRTYTLPAGEDMGWEDLDIKWKTKDGHVLSSGAQVENFRVMVDDGTEISLYVDGASEQCLEGVLQKTDVIVSFDINGGSGSIDGFETKNSSKITLPECKCENGGLVFAGWVRDGADNDSASAMPAGSCYQFSSSDYGMVTFKAMWKLPELTIITLRFKSEKTGDEFPVPSSINGLLATPPSIEVEGFDFVGWRSESTGVLLNPNTVISVSGFSNNDVFVGEWAEKSTGSDAPELVEEEETTWVTVSFDSDGGTDVESRSVPYGGEYGELPTPLKTGYRFLGWFLGGDRITEESTVSVKSDHKLKASWEAEGSISGQDGDPNTKGASNADGDSSVESSSVASTSVLAKTGDSLLAIAGVLVLSTGLCVALLALVRRREQL